MNHNRIFSSFFSSFSLSLVFHLSNAWQYISAEKENRRITSLEQIYHCFKIKKCPTELWEQICSPQHSTYSKSVTKEVSPVMEYGGVLPRIRLSGHTRSLNRLHGFWGEELFFQSFLLGRVSLKSYVLSLQIIFEAIRGVSMRSDTAIDDILFQAGPCLGKFKLTFLRRHLASHTVFFVLRRYVFP